METDYSWLNSEWLEDECPWRFQMESSETPEVVAVVVPDLEPAEPDNLALHVGRLHESHEAMRRDFDAQTERLNQMDALHRELLHELQTVEEIAEEVLEEEAVAETAVVGEPVAPQEERRAHWLTRALRGH